MPVDTSMYPNPNSASNVSNDPTAEATKLVNVLKMKNALQQLGAGQSYGNATQTQPQNTNPLPGYQNGEPQ